MASRATKRNSPENERWAWLVSLPRTPLERRLPRLRSSSSPSCCRTASTHSSVRSGEPGPLPPCFLSPSLSSSPEPRPGICTAHLLPLASLSSPPRTPLGVHRHQSDSPSPPPSSPQMKDSTTARSCTTTVDADCSSAPPPTRSTRRDMPTPARATTPLDSTRKHNERLADEWSPILEWREWEEDAVLCRMTPASVDRCIGAK